MSLSVQHGRPEKDGLYLAGNKYGWRILEWFLGKWWHAGRTAMWPETALMTAFIGPLPDVPDPLEFDL